MYFKPVTASSVSGATFGHANQQTFAQTARLARCSILLVYHAFAVVLALGDRRQVVVGSSEKALEKKKNNY